MPGRKEHSGEEIRQARFVFIRLFFDRFISFKARIFCFGRVCFLAKEVIREDIPNRPVNNGRRDSLSERLSEIRPKKPEREKMIIAQILEVFSK